MAVERIEQVLVGWEQTNETQMIAQLVARLMDDEPRCELLDALHHFHGKTALTRLAEKVLEMQDDDARHCLLRDLGCLAQRDPAAARPAMRKLQDEGSEKTTHDLPTLTRVGGNAHRRLESLRIPSLGGSSE